MNRRTALLTMGGSAISSFAGCSRKSDTEPSVTPPLEEIIIWSNLEATSQPVELQITVAKEGSQVFNTTQSFEGQTRFQLAEDWLGDAVPYLVTIESAVHDEPTTYTSTDLQQSNSIACWSLYGEFNTSSIFLSPLIGDEDC